MNYQIEMFATNFIAKLQIVLWWRQTNSSNIAKEILENWGIGGEIYQDKDNFYICYFFAIHPS